MRFITSAGSVFALCFCLVVPTAVAGTAKQVNLAGPWRFALDRQDVGITEGWFGKALAETAELPGDLAAQGIGDPPTRDTEWIGNVKHPWWENPELAPYGRPDNFKFPYWLTPEHRYMGAAWFQRDIEVPADWAGQGVVLFLERPHWETRVWVDGKLMGTNTALGTPHEYYLGKLAPGRHLLAIRVDNRMVVDVGLNSHSMSDHTQGDWNGIVGAVELRLRPNIRVEDLRVYPDMANKTFRASGKIAADGRERPGFVRFEVKRHSGKASTDSLAGEPAILMQGRIPVTWNADGGSFEWAPDPVDARRLNPWDEFSPNIYALTAILEEGGATLTVPLGLREISTSGTQFLVNGRKTFFRGTLECAIFPKTGHPPTDVASWRRILEIARAHGLNMLRFHSWCPPEAAFVAADEVGFYYQIEASSWANQSTTLGDGKPVDRWIYEESERILRYYGNHPSFALMAYGNEPGGPKLEEYLAEWLKHFRDEDPRRLYTSGSGWPQLPENQFHVTPDPRIQHWGAGLRSRINAAAPETTTDYRDYIRKRAVPVISHEIGQWCVYPNFDEIPKYTGYLKARNFEIFRDSLRRHHMGDLAPLFLRASGKLQTLCYKEDIESALRTPGMGGFQLLDLHDFPGQGTALVGVLDPFWEEKGYVTPREYNRFCNAVVPLVRLSKRVFTTDESLSASVEVANFGPVPLLGAVAGWKLLGEDGATWASGELPARTVPVDNGTSLGVIQADLSNVPAPLKGKLVVALAGTPFENDWDFWVYPADVSVAVPEGITQVRELSGEARAVLEAGGKVLLLAAPARVKPDPKLGKVALGFSSIFWNTAWTGRQPPHTLGIWCDPKHPAFAQFPTEYHSNWQWWYLVHSAGAMIMDSLPPELRPTVGVVDDWVTNRRLGLLFEAGVGTGKLVVCSMDLDSETATDPVSRQFRHSLLSYMASDAFNPQVKLSADQVRALFTEPSPMEKFGARALRSDSAEAGHELGNILDGDPSTFWHTAFRESRPSFPHELQIVTQEPVLLRGFTALPRQDGNPNGSIKGYEAYVSLDGKEWGPPVSQGEFSPGPSLKTVEFDSPRRCRYFRLRMLSGHVDGPWASLAELTLLPQK